MAELVPIPFDRLLTRIAEEYALTEAIFHLPKRKFYTPHPGLDLSVSPCGNLAGNPIGPAAGPHTQLAQNIVLSWLAGSRILELKTVQINDRLTLSRPCIDMATIGYNTEWSQELTLDESLREYVKASMLVEIFKEWLFGSPGSRVSTRSLKTIYDISVGYDLAGIQSSQIRSWLERMRDARPLIDEYRQQIPDGFSAYGDITFENEIGNSITLSTFHGTPANEIEKICEFLIGEMDFHVIIKMNPPMLGRERLEHLLHEVLGYVEIEVNPKAYDVNITMRDAIDMVRRLESFASRRNRTIGVKFGNTLEVTNRGSFLKEQIQYLSGQPLHVLHLALVDEWRKEFGPDFPVSFSAGVDAQNIVGCVAAGLLPVTMCTDLLRPGGYGRLPQYLINLEQKMEKLGVRSIDEFVIGMDGNGSSLNRGEAILHNTATILKHSLEDARYHAERNRKPPRKIGSQLRLFDCINCDKCIPVCPNDANFSFTVTPVEIQGKIVEIQPHGFREIGESALFSVHEAHQIGTFADACNECGNCDIFCPEDGGPYIEKPRFFGSKEAWKKWTTLSGFTLVREDGCAVLYGRFKNDEYRLADDPSTGIVTFASRDAFLRFDADSNIIGSELTDATPAATIDTVYFHAMKTLLRGVLNRKEIHFVNAGME